MYYMLAAGGLQLRIRFLVQLFWTALEGSSNRPNWIHFCEEGQPVNVIRLQALELYWLAIWPSWWASTWCYWLPTMAAWSPAVCSDEDVCKVAEGCHLVSADCTQQYCLAWPILNSKNLGPKRNSKMPFDHPPPTHHINFLKGSTHTKG